MPTARTTTAIFKEALELLASIDPIELCNEAKIERCRATRDLSSCGRYVQHVLNSCGHASLCAECSQRCDVCPICRISIPNNGSRLRLRLYYRCMEAGLISKRCDERFQDKDDSGGRVMADIQRLYSLFDVALENNMVSLICHYVTDVCMDENAVSSDPLLAFLLDEVVVKDWCKQTFNNIIYELQGKYSLGADEMKSNLSSFQKFAVQLTGISNVLEVMVSSLKETFSGPVHDLHHLLESTLKAKQHLEIMTWCIQHDFLENVQSRYPNYASWNFQFLQKKSAAVKRAWPDISSYTTDSSGIKPTLFIEEALSNLGIEQNDADEGEEVDIFCLQDGNSPSLLQSNVDEINAIEEVTYYPFENVRAATDILFLHGTSDMVVAKRAIFLYYLFDRHWTKPDVEWRHLIDDFAASFGISRHLVLESLTFYLLDDHSDQAVQEATHLLSEIAGPETHPKIAQVLLERQCPDVALTVLRCSGRDDFSVFPKSEHDSFPCISLNEAITVIRVRIECGLLTESFMYQRLHCSKAKELASKKKPSVEVSRNSKLDSWVYQVEVLVTEICQHCIRRNLVDRMIELPWNSDEEKFLHKCLFGHACQNPVSICGSLLVVFYLQRVQSLETLEWKLPEALQLVCQRDQHTRYRYEEARQVDCKLQSLEQNFSEAANEDVVCRINSISHWRSGLVEKGLELLPEVQIQQAMSERMADGDVSFTQDVPMSFESDSRDMLRNRVTILTPSSAKQSVLFQKSTRSFPSRKSVADVPTNFTSSINFQLESGRRAPSVFQTRLLSSLGSSVSRMNSLVDGISSPNPYKDNLSPSDDTTSEDVGWFDAKKWRHQNDHRFHGENAVKLISVSKHGENFQPHNSKFNTKDHYDLMDTSHSNGFSKEPIRSQRPKDSHIFSDTPWNMVFSEEATLTMQSFGKRDSPVEDSSMRVGSRWKSDESSEDEAAFGVDGHMGSGTRRRPARVLRR